MTLTKGYAGLPHSALWPDAALEGLWRFAGDMCRFVHVYTYDAELGRKQGSLVKPLRSFWGHPRARDCDLSCFFRRIHATENAFDRSERQSISVPE